MKFTSSIALFFISFLIFSCTDNLTEIGANIQPSDDGIVIGTDTFHVATKNLFVDSVVSNSNYFLLGNYTDSKYGATRAEILAQLMHPSEEFEPSTVIDSAKIILTYSIQGNSASPIRINVYEMKKNTFISNDLGTYYTNIDPSVYCDQSILLGQKTVTIKNNNKDAIGTDTTHIKLSVADAKRLFDLKAYYNDHDAFLTQFKGLYLTTDFGSSTMLYLHKSGGIVGVSNEILIRLYTHYNYTSGGKTSKVEIQKEYVLNSQVKQVNRIQHLDRTSIKNTMDTVTQYNYISSPANIHTQLTLPLKKIKQSMDATLGSKKQTINKAILKVEAAGLNEGVFPQPLVGKLLLIKKDSMDYFLNNHKMPSNTYAMVSASSYSTNASTGLLEYYYSYDLAALITNELKLNKNPADLEMVLVPVQQMYSLYYVPSAEISAVTIRSGKNNSSPMRVKMIYSGF